MLKPTAAALFCAALLASLVPGQTLSLVRVPVADEAGVRRLMALDLDIADHEPQVGEVFVIVHGPQDQAALDTAGFASVLVHADLEAWCQAGLVPNGADNFPALGSGSMGGYFTFDEAIAAMDCLAAAHPALVAPKVSLGQTHEGRSIWMYKVSDNVAVDEPEPEVELDAWIHAREPATFTSLYHFLTTVLAGYGTDPDFTALVDHRELYVIPCVNPDGVVYNQTTNPGGGGFWRKNRRDNGDGTFGVDLNRNYSYQWGYDNVGSSGSTGSQTYRGPAPVSEPEIQAIVGWSGSRTISVAQNAHTYGNYHLHPFGYASSAASPFAGAYAELGARMAAKSGYLVGPTSQTLYLANGISTDWWEAVRGAMAFTTEMGSQNDGFWPPTSRIVPLAEDNLPTFHEWCWFAGSNLRATSRALVPVTGNGNAWPEPGEVFDLQVTLRNVGRLATSGTVSGSIQPATAFVQVVNAAATTPGAVGSLADAILTFRIAVASTAPAAAPISVDLTVAFDGIVRTTALPLNSSVPITLFADDFETDQGWTVGAPADTGVGAWVRDDPVGTTSGSNPWQPEDDHTPGAGVGCWMTLNGSPGGGAGSSDLDGITTLTSPVLDLGNLLAPTLRFWAWFANDDRDDSLWFELSNDGGTTWVPAGYVRGLRNQWTEHVVTFADHLLPTSAARIRFRAEDWPDNSLTEAALDDFRVEGWLAALALGLTNSGGPGGTIDLVLSQPATPGHPYTISLSTTASSGLALGDGRSAGIDNGPLLLAPFFFPSIFQNWTGALGATGLAAPRILVPNDPGLHGFAFFVAGATINPAGAGFADVTGTRYIVVP